MSITTGPGIYRGVCFDDYVRIDAVNASLLWTCRERTACHAYYQREHPKPPTVALEFGTKVHMALLEPDTYQKTYRSLPAEAPRRPSDRQRFAAKPSPATMAAVKWWDDWDAAGYQEITAADADKIDAIVASVRGTQAKQYITGGQSEVCLLWRDEKTNLLCKARLDFVQEQAFGDVITDVKTTMDASEDRFRKSVYFYGYFMRAAFYSDAYQILTGVAPLFVWLAIEKEPPYVAKAWEADGESIKAGRNAYRRLLDFWAECVRDNHYPAYGEDVSIIGLERWMLENEGVSRFAMDVGTAPSGPGNAKRFEDDFDLGDDDD